MAEAVEGSRQLGWDGTLLERERELSALTRLAGEAAAGEGRLVVVEGHAGLGKTRLLHAGREIAAAAGLRVLTARATELERSFPFSLVRQLFEPALRTLTVAERDTLLDGTSGAARSVLGMTLDGAPLGAGDTFTVLHGLYWATAALAEQQPTALVVDDVHWSDEASLDYLGFLLPRLEELPLLVLVASRPGEPGAAPRLAPFVTDELARRLVPCSLSQAATGALLAAELGSSPEDGFAAACHEVSGGNPFLLRELARSIAERSIAPTSEQREAARELTPERVMRNVVLRLGRLSPDARAVSRALVVLGDDTDAGLVAALAGLDVGVAQRGMDELRAAAILDAGTALRFVHPLVRNGLYAELSAGVGELAHARAAALLRERGADAQRRAAHLVATMPSGERTTVETLMEAGMRAAADGASAAAVTYLVRALREPPPPELRAIVLGPLIMLSTGSADHTTYDAIEPDIIEELHSHPELRADWALPLTAWMAPNGRLDQASELVREAVDDVTRRGDVDRAFRLESWLCMLRQDAPAEFRARLTPYFARLAPDSPAQSLAAEVQAMSSLFDASAAEAVAYARRALEGGRLYAEFPEMSVPGWSVVALIASDELHEARHAASQVAELARTHGVTAWLAGAALMEAEVGLPSGDLAGAEAASRRGLEIVRLGATPALVPLIGNALALALIEQGDLAAAEAVLDAPDMSLRPMAREHWFKLPLFARSRLHLRQGMARQALDGFMALHRIHESGGISGHPQWNVFADAARAHVALGDRAQARELADKALAHAQRWGAPSTMSRALRAKALAVGGEEGILLLRDATSRMEGSPARLERAYALHELGAALRRSNRRTEARVPLREAIELARSCGAGALAKDAGDELQASGERRRRRHTAIGVESLTSSERRVADMAASGMTNRQIAQMLYLTVKTVETHLTATYDKLGIRSRRELAGALGSRSSAS